MKPASLRLATAALALATASAAGAATAPFTETFSSTLSGWTNQVAATATWSQDTIAGTYTATNGATATGAYTATVQVTNVNSTTFTAGTPFTVSASFQITDATAAGTAEYYGLGLFGGAANLGNAYYLADVQRNGSIRLLSLNGANADFTGGAATAIGQVLAINTTYTLQFTGTYGNDGRLDMTFELLNSVGGTIASVSATDLTPLTGQHFGFRNNLAATGDSVSITYDSFAITSVPEPSAFAAVLGLAALGATGLRRRRTSDRR